MADPVVILGAVRTPIGKFRGELAGLSAPQLGAAAIRAAFADSGVAPEQASACLMGCVLPAGQGQAPARQAALGAGLPLGVECTTLNKMCGSGMMATMTAADFIRAGARGVIVAGGMESMSNAPFLARRSIATGKPEDGPLQDHMFLDGLEDAYERGRSMGVFAEDCAEQYQFTRGEQDRFAAESLDNARRAQSDGRLRKEIAPIPAGGGEHGEIPERIESDELPRKADPARIPEMKPAFREAGTVTAANASAISDGAAALLLAAESEADAMGVAPRARICGQSGFAGEPARYPTAPITAIERLLAKTGWRAGDVDLWEVNEAFAVVAMVAMREVGIPRQRLNVHGGACALGHPIGASGARILVTLLNAMEARNAVRGVAAICIGGGEATAMAITRNDGCG